MAENGSISKTANANVLKNCKNLIQRNPKDFANFLDNKHNKYSYSYYNFKFVAIFGSECFKAVIRIIEILIPSDVPDLHVS